jgi:hypothetical protein
MSGEATFTDPCSMPTVPAARPPFGARRARYSQASWQRSGASTPLRVAQTLSLATGPRPVQHPYRKLVRTQPGAPYVGEGIERARQELAAQPREPIEPGDEKVALTRGILAKPIAASSFVRRWCMNSKWRKIYNLRLGADPQMLVNEPR